MNVRERKLDGVWPVIAALLTVACGGSVRRDIDGMNAAPGDSNTRTQPANAVPTIPGPLYLLADCEAAGGIAVQSSGAPSVADCESGSALGPIDGISATWTEGGVCCKPVQSRDGQKLCGGQAGDTCDAAEYCAFEASQDCGQNGAKGTCQPRPDACPTENANPVCGCDGRTYPNQCAATQNGTSAASPLPPGTLSLVAGANQCSAADKHPPLCSATQHCGLDGYCAYLDGSGCRSDALGTCKPLPTQCSEEYAPVCGCNGVQYANACIANSAGVAVAYARACD